MLEQYTAHGSLTAPKLKGSGSKGKPTGSEAVAHRKLLKGIDDERRLAERLAELLPVVEKEEAVSAEYTSLLISRESKERDGGSPRRAKWRSWPNRARRGRDGRRGRWTTLMVTSSM